jgi:hypothetical protein
MKQFQVSEIKYQENTWNPLNAERVAFYKTEFAAKRDVAPISVDEEMNLVDGRHRLAAVKELGHKTIAGDLHIMTPLDLPGRKAVADAIDASSRERAKQIKIVDRRDPASVRTELGNLQRRGAAQESDLSGAQQYVVQLTGRLVSLRKLKKQYEKVTEAQPRNRSLIEEVDGKISAVEQNLTVAKKNQDRLTRIVASIAEQVTGFLAQSPGKGFPSNEKLLADHTEVKKLERELADYAAW